MKDGLGLNRRRVHPGAGLVFVLLVSASAGSLQGYTVGGAVAGMAVGQQISLTNNGGDSLTLIGNGPFVFATPLASNAAFAVSVSAQPYQEQCNVANGSGAASGTDIRNILVNCAASPLGQIQSFASVIGSTGNVAGISAIVAGSPAQLVMSGGFGEVTGPQFSRNNIDPSHSKIVLGYIDVAEAAANQQPELFVNGTVPSWFGAVTVAQFGLYSVQYWNPTWKAIIFKEIDSIIAQGFDGIYLDVLYGDYNWSPKNNLGNPVYADATPAMAGLLSDIVAYVKNKSIPQFYLLGSNPMFIAAANPSSLDGLSAIFFDGLYYNLNVLNSYSRYWTQQYSMLAQIYRATGLPVLGADYPPAGNLAEDFQAFAYFTAYGWVPTVNPQPAALTANLAVMSTGPFMFMATPANPTINGVKNALNFLSGGLAANAVLTGGNQGDYFIGGPGTNTITGGSGNDMIYAHPANAAQKGILEIQLSATLKNGTYPTATILINGSIALPATPITADDTQFQTQDFRFDLSKLGTLSSLEIRGGSISYKDANSFNNLYVDSISISGAHVLLNNGVYSQSSNAVDYNGTRGLLNFAGTVSFSAAALNVVSPLLPNCSDAIDGGGGTNTVVYRGPYSNYSITRLGDGSLLVTSRLTAEGPDRLVNVQVLQFSDQSINTSTIVAPSISPGGVTELYNSSGSIQPGSWISLYGSNLASVTATWNNDFPTLLGGVSVTMNGKPAYLWYVSPNQINLQAPDDTATGPVDVVITNTSGSAKSTVNLAPIAPSILLLDGKHVTGIILRSDGSGAYGGGTYDIVGPTGSSLGYATVAAKPGDVLELFGVGFGPTEPPVRAGHPFLGAAATTNPVQLVIGGTTVTPSFAGLVGAGLYQINFTIPVGAGKGDVPIVAKAGGVQTQSGLAISIQ